MRVIHDPPYRPTKGKFCIVGGRPVNKGLACCKCLVQNEALNGGRRSPGVAVGGVAELSRKSSGLFHGSGYSDSTNPPWPGPAEVLWPEKVPKRRSGRSLPVKAETLRPLVFPSRISSWNRN